MSALDGHRHDEGATDDRQPGGVGVTFPVLETSRPTRSVEEALASIDAIVRLARRPDDAPCRGGIAVLRECRQIIVRAVAAAGDDDEGLRWADVAIRALLRKAQDEHAPGVSE